MKHSVCLLFGLLLPIIVFSQENDHQGYDRNYSKGSLEARGIFSKKEPTLVLEAEMLIPILKELSSSMIVIWEPNFCKSQGSLQGNLSFIREIPLGPNFIDLGLGFGLESIEHGPLWEGLSLNFQSSSSIREVETFLWIERLVFENEWYIKGDVLYPIKVLNRKLDHLSFSGGVYFEQAFIGPFAEMHIKGTYFHFGLGVGYRAGVVLVTIK